jgi:signal transduction histidine kinase
VTESLEQLAAERHALDVLNRTGARVAAELDLNQLVQTVVEAAVEVTAAQFGAFFYNVADQQGGQYMLYALAGADRKSFEKFGLPRATSVFAPTFRGEGVIRSADILKDERYGKNAPHSGMPAGHLPVRSYLAVPVTSRSGEVIGGLFFGHEEPNIFHERAERLMVGLAAQAAIGIDNARLFQAAKRANETLEERIRERSDELEQAYEALRQSQKMEAVGQLTGGIAHDFNNLLAGIVGSLDLMQTRISQGRTDSLERYAKAAMSSAQRAAALTHRLLAFSRRQPLDPRPVSANALLTSMEDLLRRTIGPLHALEFVTAGGLWTTLCDPNQLESAILNLAINARDAMPDGGRLTVETCNAHLDDAYVAKQRDIRAGQYICICVTDTGTGMPPEVIERAFEPFFTTKPLGQGTGLGLSMVYGFAKQSEGHLKIYSEVGQGTTIKIYLPRYRGKEEDEDTGSAALEEEAVRAEAGETVLVVEDEPVIRDLIVEILQDLGYRALEAVDGPTGLRILQSRERIDLLVTDVGLPGLNGRQLADHARQSRPGLKVSSSLGTPRTRPWRTASSNRAWR